MVDLEIDEGKWKDLTQEEREKLLKTFMETKVNKRCEACGFYAATYKDMLSHASTSKHGFINNGHVLQVLSQRVS